MPEIAELTPNITELLAASFTAVGFVFLLNALLNGLAHWVAYRFWDID